MRKIYALSYYLLLLMLPTAARGIVQQLDLPRTSRAPAPRSVTKYGSQILAAIPCVSKLTLSRHDTIRPPSITRFYRCCARVEIFYIPVGGGGGVENVWKFENSWDGMMLCRQKQGSWCFDNLRKFLLNWDAGFFQRRSRNKRNLFKRRGGDRFKYLNMIRTKDKVAAILRSICSEVNRAKTEQSYTKVVSFPEQICESGNNVGVVFLEKGDDVFEHCSFQADWQPPDRNHPINICPLLWI